MRTIYINNLGLGLDHMQRVHLYADDTIIYTVASSLQAAIDSTLLVCIPHQMWQSSTDSVC